MLTTGDGTALVMVLDVLLSVTGRLVPVGASDTVALVEAENEVDVTIVVVMVEAELDETGKLG